MAAGFPGFIQWENVDVGVGDVGAHDLDEGASVINLFETVADFFDGVPESGVIIVGEVINFIDFYFRDDEDVAAGFGVVVEESVSFFVFVDFVSRDFALDDFGENG